MISFKKRHFDINVLRCLIFVTGEDYIWGTGKVGVKCKGKTFHCNCIIRDDIEVFYFSFVSDIFVYDFL